MSTANELTFAPYAVATNQAINAAGPLTTAIRVRDKRNNLVSAQPGDYVLQDEDGSLRVMGGVAFEAEHTAIGTITAPNTLTRAGGTTTTVDLSWTVGDAAAYGHVEKAGVEITINDPNDGTYTATGLVANTSYSFRVRNRKNEKFSAYLTALVAYTLPLPIADAPTASAVTATGFTVTWVNADATAETEIHIDDGLGGAFSIFSTEAAAATSKAITGLTAERDYIVKLKHKGVLSDLVSATFSPILEQSTPPA